MSLVLPATVREQPRPLSQCDDPAGPLPRRLCERCPRHTVVAGKGDQLLDVAIRVVPLFDHVRQVVWSPRAHRQERNGNIVNSILYIIDNWPVWLIWRAKRLI
jgi:hypothetical protein